MSDYYMGEIRIMSFNFAPKNWALCNGQLLSIQQNQALFSLLGTTYGGNGVNNFALPDLRARTPLHASDSLPLGAVLGQFTHTLISNEMPQHFHVLNANTSVPGTSNVSLPTNNTILGNAAGKASSGSPPPFLPYSANTASLTPMDPRTLGSQGGSQPHENRQPFLALTVCIALNGIFPSRN